MNKLITKYQYFILAILLLVGFAVRLYRINYPLADWHSWRQADTAAVTRNFVKLGVDIFHPRYDDFSDVSGRGLLNPEGFRFVEFPIFNLVHYFVYSIGQSFGSLVFWGRITTILSALVSSVLLFYLVRRHTQPLTGLLAGFFYLFLPFNIYFTRVILPDPLMVTFYLAALNFWDLYITPSSPPLKFRGGRGSYFLLTCIFGALAVLVKPVAIFFLLPITWWFWTKYKIQTLKVPKFYILHFTFLFPFLLWRLWEHRFPAGIPASIWLLNGDHIRFKPAFWRWLFGERIGKMILGVWGLFPAVTGLLDLKYFYPWILGAFTYMAVFAMGNVRHDYYQIPVIPAISVLLAVGFSKLFLQNLKYKIVGIFCLFMMLGMSWYDLRGNFNVNNWDMVTAGQRIDTITPKDAIVVAPYNGDTAFLFQTNRRGFAYMPFPIKDLIDRFNATYYVSVNYDDQTRAIMAKYTVVEENPKYVIVKLIEPKKEQPI